jgi:hypothetical protein
MNLEPIIEAYKTEYKKAVQSLLNHLRYTTPYGHDPDALEDTIYAILGNARFQAEPPLVPRALAEDEFIQQIRGNVEVAYAWAFKKIFNALTYARSDQTRRAPDIAKEIHRYIGYPPPAYRVMEEAEAVFHLPVEDEELKSEVFNFLRQRNLEDVDEEEGVREFLEKWEPLQSIYDSGPSPAKRKSYNEELNRKARRLIGQYYQEMFRLQGSPPRSRTRSPSPSVSRTRTRASPERGARPPPLGSRAGGAWRK